MKLTHVHQTHVEKQLTKCHACDRFIFRSRWVVEDPGKRTVLCETCVSAVRKETDRLFMQRIKEMVHECTETTQDRTP